MKINITADCKELNMAIGAVLLKIEALNTLENIPQATLSKINDFLVCLRVKGEICEIGNVTTSGAGELVVTVGPGAALKEFIATLGTFSADIDLDRIWHLETP
jgi:hypothetical protein